MSAPAGIDPALYEQALTDVRALRAYGTLRPTDRLSVWSQMARDLAAEGRTYGQIAADLCVSEETARSLCGAL